jgi:hypothetical protein|tara:strand:+ start:367 stop:486 length:120 start_codon:yes stop_codon:yes gene_type:complete
MEHLFTVQCFGKVRPQLPIGHNLLRRFVLWREAIIAISA